MHMILKWVENILTAKIHFLSIFNWIGEVPRSVDTKVLRPPAGLPPFGPIEAQEWKAK